MPGQKNLQIGIALIALAFFALAPAPPKLPPVLIISPSSHNFGQVPLGGGMNNAFIVSLPAGTTPGPRISAAIAGVNAGDFSVNTSNTLGNTVGAPCASTWPKACYYIVEFRPLSLGVKTANLVVSDGRGNLGTASLSGTGIAAPAVSCIPYLVSCNWARFYSGTYSVNTVSSASVGVTSIGGRWDTTTDIIIANGVATCSVTQDDWEQDGSGSSLRSRSTVKGIISGPGLFAIEFTKNSSGVLEYVLHFDCPSPTLTTTSIDYIAGTSSTGSIPSEPADWRHASLGADPLPATSIGMSPLKGSQQDLQSPGANNGVTGTSRMTWDLKR